MTIEVLYQDTSIIVIYKPAGLATQSANPAVRDCVSLIKEHIKKSTPNLKGEPYLGVIHRLDQPVAGVLVFAKEKRAAAALSDQVRGDVMNKHYMAVVEGILDVPEDTELTDRIYKDSRKSMAVIADGPCPANVKLQEARLLYRTDRILGAENMTVLSIKLMTGRFHQIRAQLSHMGHPIVGDAKYGAVTKYPSGIALAADRLEFIHPLTGEKVEKIVDFSFAL